MKKGRVLVCGLIFLVMILWTFYPLWSYLYKSIFYNSKLLDIGIFGDSYGALNTLFSGLAFTGIIVSIYFQSQELAETRRDINRQTMEFESQTEVLRKQAFENTFFQMLTVFRSNSESVYINEVNDDESIDVFTGRKAFRKLLILIRSSFYRRMGRNKGTPLEVMRKVYIMFDRTYNISVGPYYRTLYQIMKFIDDSSISDLDKKLYSNILRAQISSYELSVIFYCGLSIYGDGLFKGYLEKYEFFEHLLFRTINLGDDNEHIVALIRQYDVQAYGKTNTSILKCYNSV
ncbi:putative phage abortive infection protein [Aeromonas caviae]